MLRTHFAGMTSYNPKNMRASAQTVTPDAETECVRMCVCVWRFMCEWTVLLSRCCDMYAYVVTFVNRYAETRSRITYLTLRHHTQCNGIKGINIVLICILIYKKVEKAFTVHCLLCNEHTCAVKQLAAELIHRAHGKVLRRTTKRIHVAAAAIIKEPKGN